MSVIETPSDRRLSAKRSANAIYSLTQSEDDNAPHLVESADVPMLRLSDCEVGEAFQCQDSLATNYTDELSNDKALKAFQGQGQESTEIVVDVAIANSISLEVTVQTEQDVNAMATSSNEHDHNLQPVEVLTSQVKKWCN